MESAQVLPPELYQLFLFNFPRMKKQRRNAALGWKVREAVPLNPKQYRWRTTWLLRGRRATALVAVLKAEDDGALGPGPGARGFPVRVPSKTTHLPWHHWNLVYEGGWLASIHRRDTPLGQDGEVGGRGPRVLVDREYRFGAPRGWGLFLGLAGLVLWGLVAWNVTNSKEQEALQWERWSQTLAAEGQPVVAKSSDWKVRTGFPLRGLLDAMANAWGTQYKLVTLSTEGISVTIEAQGPGAVRAVEALRLQRGLTALRLVKTTRLESGLERFLVTGEVTLDP